MPESVHVIDHHYQGTREAIASYVIDAPRGPVLFETGPGSTFPALVEGLNRIGLSPRDIRDVFVTHIHLDHAGAAGHFAREGATIYVHEFGAKHLIDPSRLLASAKRIYQERMERLWGETLPCPESQVVALHDGDVIDAAGLSVLAIETPGHARHHHAFACEVSGERIAFTGDAGACFVHEAPGFISLPTPPPEFERDQWIASLDRLEARGFDVIYPTHFGRVEDVTAHFARSRLAVRQHSDMVREMLVAHVPRDLMLKRYTEWFVGEAERAGVPAHKMDFYVKSSLAEMNLTGMLRYWTATLGMELPGS
jgi:glyoxylase-like metal-dependent hydrolase (beta-lactamase superfamily II)